MYSRSVFTLLYTGIRAFPIIQESSISMSLLPIFKAEFIIYHPSCSSFFCSFSDLLSLKSAYQTVQQLRTQEAFDPDPDPGCWLKPAKLDMCVLTTAASATIFNTQFLRLIILLSYFSFSLGYSYLNL